MMTRFLTPIRSALLLMAAVGAMLWSATLRGSEPNLTPGSLAPAGMEILKEGVTLRLKNAVARFRLHSAKSFTSTQNSSLFYPGYVFMTRAIRPAGTPFADSFGTEWFDVTPGGGTNELILNSSLSALLDQPGVAAADKVGLGRWAITELRLASPRPTVSGQIVSYRFDIMCYAPGGATGGGILVNFLSSMVLSFPVTGVSMGSVSPTGTLEPEQVISPVDFSFTVTEPQPGTVREQLTAVFQMTDFRPWIFGHGSTFDLGGWSLDTPTSDPGRLAVRDAWGRAFSNVGRHVYEASLGTGRTLGFRRGGSPVLPAFYPFFFHNFPIDSQGRATPVSGNLQTHLQTVAATAPMEGAIGFPEDIVLHAAPSPSVNNAVACVPVTLDDATFVENQAQPRLKLRFAYPAPAGVQVRLSPQAGGTMQGATDYIFPEQTISIPPGRTVVEVPFALVNDSTAEPEKSLRLRIAVMSGLACVADEEAIVTLVDDDGTGFTGPAIVSEPEDQAVAAGSPATLGVEAAGTGLSYQWYRETTLLTGRTAATLGLPAAQTTDSGRYRVKVSNASGFVLSRLATLTVTTAQTAPTITQEPADATVTAGGSASFTVVAGGSGTLAYLWQFRATAAATWTTVGGNSATLALSNVQSTQAGQYRVIVSNGVSPDATSRTATLTVNSGPAPEIAVEWNGSNLTDNAGTIPFGQTLIGSSASQSITIRNVGSAVMSGLAASLFQGNAGDFAVGTGLPGTLAHGGATTLTLRFQPTAGGVRTTTLRIASNDSDENPFEITLSGTGVAGVLSLSSPSGLVPPGGGSFSITVHTNLTWSWSSDAAWLTAPGEAAVQKGTQTFTFSAAANPTGSPRTGTLSFSAPGQPTVTHTLTQSAADDHGNTPGTATQVGENTTTPGNIETAGDVDVFRIDVTQPGTLIARTISSIDTLGSLLDSAGGELITDDDSHDANFELRQPVQPGTYYVRVSLYDPGAVGSYQLACRLWQAPAIVEQPASASLVAGDAVTLRVRASGENPAFQWYVGPSGDQSMPIVGEKRPTLSVRPQNSTSYWVEVSNAGGSTFSDSADLSVSTTIAGWQWSTDPNSGVTSTLWGVEWLGRQFVAVGDGGVILTSPDGAVWTRRNAGVTAQLESVAWNGQEHVAVGLGGTIVSSSDGETWTARSSGTTAELNSVAWHNGAFWAVGPANGLRRSTNGRTWTAATANNATGYNLRSVLGSGLVLVGPNTIQTSQNGTTWSTKLTVSGMFFDDMATSGNRWMAVGSDGKVRSSVDEGDTWSAPLTVSSTWLRGVATDGAGFVVVGNNGTVFATDDGVNWFQRNLAIDGVLHSIAWNGRSYVAVGENGVIVRSVGSWRGASAIDYRSWAAASGLTGKAAAEDADWDRDGTANMVEYFTGNHPCDPASRWDAVPLVWFDGTDWQVMFSYTTAPVAEGYFVGSESSDAEVWMPLNANSHDDGTNFTTRMEWSTSISSGGPPTRFFRFTAGF